ncbi:MAG: outer membrane lipoprotein carrier protein LolA [Chitinophagaceae bacterium]|nr:outer membrane lipoprotein carrier protein LolA [Chitinophagaceae bacterium]
MHKKTIIVLSVVIAVLTANGQYAGYTLLKDDATFHAQFAAASQKINSLKSDFIQEKNISLLDDKIVSKGSFWFKKENSVRMEYHQPFQYLLIINGTNIYIKDSQKENKISTRSNKLFQQINQIIIDCVNGKALQGNEFTTRIFEGSTAYLAELTPVEKNMKQFFSHINMMIDKKTYNVNRIEMHEPSGDDTSIRFKNPQFNTALPDALFAIR